MTVLIAAACRSPFTRIEGALAGWHPVDLAAHIMNETLTRAAVNAADVDEVWVGCAEPVGAQGANMARAAVLTAGWPDHIGGAVIDRAETSGTAALHAAVAAVESGAVRTAMVVGVCNASMVQPGASALARAYGRPWGDGPARRVEPEGGLLPAPAAADRAASRLGIDRLLQEDWAARSHDRRAQATPASVAPTDARPGDRVAIQRGTPIGQDDQRDPPADVSSLPPSFDPDGEVTGFTFAPPADGVAALLLVADDSTPRAAIVGVGRSAGDPRDPLGGLERAAERALHQAHCTIADVDRWEVVEPTAAATLLAIERLELDQALVNVAGGTLGVGDAAAAEELRLVTDALAGSPSGTVIAAATFGPAGAAVTIVRCP